MRMGQSNFKVFKKNYENGNYNNALATFKYETKLSNETMAKIFGYSRNTIDNVCCGGQPVSKKLGLAIGKLSRGMKLERH